MHFLATSAMFIAAGQAFTTSLYCSNTSCDDRSNLIWRTTELEFSGCYPLGGSYKYCYLDVADNTFPIFWQVSAYSRSDCRTGGAEANFAQGGCSGNQGDPARPFTAASVSFLA